MRQTYKTYVSLMQFSAWPGGLIAADANLGAKLFYADDLDDASRPMIAAANIAGAATLAASPHLPALRQAQRDGLVDFQVNSLDEALRILKNEIRRGQPVAVAVSRAPDAVQTEMIERGVLPDILRPTDPSSSSGTKLSAFLAQGALRFAPQPFLPDSRLWIWPIPPEFAQRPVAFEDLLSEHLAPKDDLNRRWLHLSPRYLGVAARRLRSLGCDDSVLSKLTERAGPPLPVGVV